MSNILKTMKIMGYAIDKSGMCHGIATSLLIRSIVDGDNFEKNHLNLIQYMKNPRKEDQLYWDLRAFFDEIVLFQNSNIANIIPPSDKDSQKEYHKNFKGVIKQQNGPLLANFTGKNVKLNKSEQHLILVDIKNVAKTKNIIKNYLLDGKKMMLAVDGHEMSLFPINKTNSKFCFINHDGIDIRDDVDSLLDYVLECSNLKKLEKFAINIHVYKNGQQNYVYEDKFNHYDADLVSQVKSNFIKLAFQDGHAEAIKAFVDGVLESNLDNAVKKELLLAKNADDVPSIKIAFQNGHAEAIKAFVDGVLASNLGNEVKSGLSKVIGKKYQNLLEMIFALRKTGIDYTADWDNLKDNPALQKAVIALDQEDLLNPTSLKAVIALDQKALLDDINLNLIKNDEGLQKVVIALNQKGLLADNFELIKDNKDIQTAVIALDQDGLLNDNSLKAVIALDQDGLLADKFELIKDNPELQDAVIPLEQNPGANRQGLDNQNIISSELMCQAIATIQDGMTGRNNRKYGALNFVATYCDLHKTVSHDLAKKVIQTALQRRGWGGGKTASGTALVNYLNSNQGIGLKNALFPNKFGNVEYSDLRTFCNKARNELTSGNKENLYREYSLNEEINQMSVNKKMKDLNYTI